MVFVVIVLGLILSGRHGQYAEGAWDMEDREWKTCRSTEKGTQVIMKVNSPPWQATCSTWNNLLVAFLLCSITEHQLSPLRVQLEELDTRIKEQVHVRVAWGCLSTIYICADFGEGRIPAPPPPPLFPWNPAVMPCVGWLSFSSSHWQVDLVSATKSNILRNDGKIQHMLNSKAFLSSWYIAL